MITTTAIYTDAAITACSARVLLKRVNGDYAWKTMAAVGKCHASLGFVLLNRKTNYVVGTKNVGLV